MDLTFPLAPQGALGVSPLLVALILGLAFGVALERAGFGSSVKLAGQFYLRDFAVLKVMFTAIVTAMTGAWLLSKAGLLRLDLLEVPPTFLLAQLVGGLIFGAGFVIGGLCPGTGCVAAASGRLDGVALIAGMLVGVFAFGEAYPLVRGLYLATPMGNATLDGLLGIPRGAAVLLVLVLAGGAFAAAEWWERRALAQSGEVTAIRRP